MAESVGIWLHDRNLKLISKDRDALSYRIQASWVKGHTDYPIKPGMTVVIGNIKPPNQLKNVLVLRTCLVSFKNYLQEGQYHHLKTAVKGAFTVFPKSPTFV